MKTLTLDTGALIGLERRRERIWKVLHGARALGVVPVVPADVVAEWWRGRTDIRYTSDVPDFERLRTFFPAVRVFAA